MDSKADASNTTQKNRAAVLNTPNLITLTRFALSIVVFALMSHDYFYAAFWVFVIAASTDWVDGYVARRTDQVTQLGRILDPFCDKIIICGAYILIAIETSKLSGSHWSLITGWMAVVVVGRELLVTMLRGYIEQHGGDFSANRAGKLKMVFQCIAVGGCLLVFALENSAVPFAVSIGWITAIAVWVAIISTIYSGILYVFAATKMVKDLTRHGDAT
ncbi:MAG TPA: CDP-diacylglycerol--glycerol-3-phosphate 3-phosphatidyltransferase [Planctomycetes bacterium]|nr:CDP-diacylglycerol--glycerol-3-phosphate 3-phosphatidyltransferase [Planctomycetaceae bacterium]HIN54674.1 CDP-diacylglycerol--glycerol-3-phosphate 3-phosphatidyltransferase [Planctomycetota bacterium]